MGASASCESCPVAITHSVITFSDELVDKISEGIEPEPLTKEEMKKREMPDNEWFEKLKCIDHSHSVAFGISVEGFYSLCHRIEKHFQFKQPLCNKEILEDCYKKHPNDTLRCKKFIDKYFDCVESKTMKMSQNQMLKEQEETKKRAKHK